jgi:hypothetical protein
MAEPSEETIARIAAHAANEAVRHAKSLSQTEMSNIALAAAKEAVRETHAELFALLGYNIADFKDINRLRGNLEFLNALHTNTSRASSRFMLGTVTLLIGAVGAALWMGLKAALGK